MCLCETMLACWLWCSRPYKVGTSCLRLHEASQGKEPCMGQQAIPGGRHVGSGSCLKLHEARQGEELCVVHAV